MVKQKACRAEGVMNDSVTVSTRKRGVHEGFKAKFPTRKMKLNMSQMTRPELRAFHKVSKG